MKKWHKTALAVIVIVGVLLCVKSCVGKKEADITVAYIGSNFVDYNAFEETMSAINDLSWDITGDGEVNIDITEISFSDELGQSDKDNSSKKLASALGMGQARVYILEQSYVVNNADYGVFEDLSSLGDGFKNSDGTVVAISLKDNELIKSMGFSESDNLYLAVRCISEIDRVTDKEIDQKHILAMKIAEYILK